MTGGGLHSTILMLFFLSLRMNNKVRALFSALGSRHVNQLGFRDNWVFLGAKGMKDKSPFEEVHGPATISHVSLTYLQALPHCKYAQCHSLHDVFFFSFFSCSTSKMTRKQINMMVGQSCWRWKAVPPGSKIRRDTLAAHLHGAQARSMWTPTPPGPSKPPARPHEAGGGCWLPESGILLWGHAVLRAAASCR